MCFGFCCCNPTPCNGWSLLVLRTDLFFPSLWDRREGLISRQAFFEGIIQEERNEFGKAIFALVDPEDEEMLEFG